MLTCANPKADLAHNGHPQQEFAMDAETAVKAYARVRVRVAVRRTVALGLGLQ